MNSRSLFPILILLLSICSIPTRASHAQMPDFSDLLSKGNISGAEQVLQKHVDGNPGDDQARFGLGIVQFLRSVEHLGQSLHRYGSNNSDFLPFLRIPVGENENPEPIDIEKFRAIFETMVLDLDRAEKTLAGIQSDDVQLPLAIFSTSFDINRDGVQQESESLVSIAQPLVWRIGEMQLDEKKIVFDKADVHWLRGYCHLLRAMCHFMLAHDFTDTWDMVGHRLFKNASVKYEFLKEELDDQRAMGYTFFADLIAGIHQLSMPVTDRERMGKVREHLLAVIAQSRLMWKHALAETDNNNEWIPNPRQQAVLTNTRVTEQMVAAWQDFLNESEKILNGELLVPFWRGRKPNRGVNFKKFFMEPREFDLLLWIHGSAATPYLEEGNVSSPETWAELQDVFRGDFFGFAAWFN